MTNRIAINNVDHGDLTVSPRHGADFGDQVNSVRLFPTEYEDAAREYPILFRRHDDGQMFAVALLGFDRDENLWLADGRWQARYVPAVQALGPFSIGMPRDGEAGEPMIHVDLDDPRVGRGGEGVPVFRQHGGNTPYLDGIADTLRRIATGLEAEPAMFAAFDRAGLLRSVELQVEVGEGRRYDLQGFLTIDTARLDELTGAPLDELHRAGFLRLAFAAAASLGNMSRLIDLKRRVRG